MTRTLLVASAGGHLDELRIHAQRLGIAESNAVWVTSPTPQTESLLAGRDVVWVPRVGSGEVRKAMAGVPEAVRIHRRVRPDLVVSTGALFSTPHLLAARLARCETWFIDSATRVAAPSSTGRFAQHLTRAKLFAQGDGWGDPRWTPVPSVFDSFEVDHTAALDPPPEIRRAVVTLGSELWPFDRAVRRVLDLLPDAEICWQTGVTDYRHEGHTLQQWLPAEELRRRIREADVVVMHAGVGSALVCLDEGKVPVILPRRSSKQEMVDDHQVEVAGMLAARSLAISVDPDDLSRDDLDAAAGLRTRRTTPVLS
ncbi:glycosyltransferase [Nocardioides jensenii]|uniref:glycosyltransferase n=1 Tax=Nocardioides jensenii TaxID=1843 RepID=UPI000833D6FF|nr:glycosyltransferase [Nocardioides jensenii]